MSIPYVSKQQSMKCQRDMHMWLINDNSIQDLILMKAIRYITIQLRAIR